MYNSSFEIDSLVLALALAIMFVIFAAPVIALEGAQVVSPGMR